jgi:hypothetical protein
VADEPRARKVGHSGERTWFLEQVCGAGHDGDVAFRCRQRRLGVAAEGESDRVVPADDEQRRCVDVSESPFREVGSATTRNHGRHILTRLGSRHEGGGGARARPGVADGQAVDLGLLAQPVGDVDQPAGEQVDRTRWPGRAPRRASAGRTAVWPARPD